MSEILLQTLMTDPAQGHARLKEHVWPWAKPLLAAGHQLLVECRFAEDAKTDAQRRYYHGAILKQIAAKAEANGQKFPLKVWKEYFRDKYLGFKTVTCINPMTGKKSRRRVRISTEDLGVRAYNTLIEKVTAFAVTELHITFDAWVDPVTGEVRG